MNSTTPPTHLVCETYGVTRQALHQLSKRHRLTIGDWRNPDDVFSRLIESGRSGKLRSRLSDPTTRITIAEKLKP